MSLLFLLLFLFFILGVSISPLLFGIAIASFSDERSRKWAERAVWLGLKSVYKPVLTFNAGDELTLKRRKYDEKHNAVFVSFGAILKSVNRYLFDPQDRIHAFYGIPFGFVDELFGAIVDPRDVVVSREFRHEQENGSYTHRVERDGQLLESVKACFEIPRGSLGTRLTDVWYMIGGSADAQILEYVRDIYQKSQEPRAQTTAFRQLLLPLGTFVAIVLLGMFVAGQTSAGGGGGGGGPPAGNSTTLNVGALLLLFSLSSLSDLERNWQRLPGVFLLVLALAGAVTSYLLGMSPWTSILGAPLLVILAVIALAGIVLFAAPPFRTGDATGGSSKPKRPPLALPDANWRDLAVQLVLAGTALGLTVMMVLALPFPVGPRLLRLPVGLWAMIVLAIGMAIPPVTAFWLGRSTGLIGIPLGKLYLTIGIALGWKRPVIYYDDGEYRIVEYGDCEWEVEPKWYRFAFSRVGIGLDNREDNWPQDTTLSIQKIEGMGQAGDVPEEDPLNWPAPTGHVATELIAVDDIHGFVPDDPDEHDVFVRSDRTTGWLLEAGQDRRLLSAALLSGKREFAGGRKPVGDKWILGMSLAMAVMGVVFDYLVFFK